MPQIVHAADFHLDSPFDFLPPDKAALLRREQRNSFEEFCRLAEHAEIVLLSGDIFDSNHPYYETVELVRDLLSSLPGKVFIAPGNHDFYSRNSVWTSLPFAENVHIFKSPRIEKLMLPDLSCCVYGAGFISPYSKPLLTGFTADRSEISIMLLHAQITASDSPYAPLSPADITASGLDYLALGHVHSFSGFSRYGRTVCAYSGCACPRGFDESGKKGFICGNVSEYGAALHFCTLPGREFKIIESSDTAFENLPAEPQNLCKIILRGEKKLSVDTVRNALSKKYFYLSIQDERKSSRNFSALDDSGNLESLFLKKLKESGESPELIELAALYGIAALENREEPNYGN